MVRSATVCLSVCMCGRGVQGVGTADTENSEGPREGGAADRGTLWFISCGFYWCSDNTRLGLPSLLS